MANGHPTTQPYEVTSATLIEIDRIAAARSSNVSWGRRSWLAQFAPIESLTDKAVNTIVDKVDEKQIDTLIETIQKRRDKLFLSSNTTVRIVGICQTILAFGAGGLALTVGFADKVKFLSLFTQKALAIVGITYFELVLVSILVLIWHLLQSRFRYPSVYFEKIGNAWPYFYYASITPVSRSPIQTPAQRFEASVNFAKDMVTFADSVVRETPRTKLRAEVQQYFLLMSYSAYSHQFSVRLVNLFMYGLLSVLATCLVLFGLLLGGML